MVAAGIADEVLVQLAYAIGIAEPVGVFINTYGTAKVKDAGGKVMADGAIAKKIQEIFDLRPYAIVKRFGLKNPVFRVTSTYGHFGRDPYTEEVEVDYNTHQDTITRVVDGKEKHFKKVEFFAWEKLDYVDRLKTAFEL